MGIPSYFSYIIKNYKDIIKKFTNDFKVKALYMDCNSIIYDIIRSTEVSDRISKQDYEKKIINLVCEKIKSYCSLINPQQTLYIAFDGIAPVAKLQQQRTRRYKNKFMELYNEKNEKKNNKHENKDKEENKKTFSWDKAAITPGTGFMNNLNKMVKDYFKVYKKDNLKIIVDTSDYCGEGEHKIFEYIRNNENNHKQGNTVIYGLDADLIMLTINHLSICKNCYLFRETPEFIKSIDKSLDPNCLYVMDIPLFKNTLLDYLNDGKENLSIQENNVIYDYIFICFMLGNDFLPHFPALNIRSHGLDIVLECYKNVIAKKGKNLTDGKKIIWKNVRDFIYQLSTSEEEYIKNEHKSRDKLERMINNNKENCEDILNFPLTNREIEKYINPYERYWQKRYYTMCFHEEMDEKKIKECCFNYLQGLEWTFKYYTKTCVDWSWKYNYHYPPLLQDLYKYVPYFEEDLIIEKKKQPITNYAQLCYVLPKQSLHLIPKNLETMMLNNYKENYTNLSFLWPYCRYFWESHIELPDIDINQLQQNINNYCN